jgi:hypothetical protein
MQSSHYEGSNKLNHKLVYDNQGSLVMLTPWDLLIQIAGWLKPICALHASMVISARESALSSCNVSLFLNLIWLIIIVLKLREHIFGIENTQKVMFQL